MAWPRVCGADHTVRVAGTYPPVRPAHVDGTDANRQPERPRHVLDEAGNLLDELLLDLEAPGEVVNDAVVFGQADDPAVRGRNHSDEGFAIDRHQVVRAGRADRDRARHDQVVEPLGVLEFGDLGGRGEPAAEEFADHHPRHPPRRVPGVVVVAMIDQQNVEQFLDLLRRCRDHRLLLGSIQGHGDSLVASARRHRVSRNVVHRFGPFL
jgi:hypothetical protein